MWYCIPKQQTIIAPCDITINGIDYPAAIFTSPKWSDEDRAALGIVPYREENASPANSRPIEWAEGLEDGVWVRRATAWEPVPAPVPSAISVRQLHIEAEKRGLDLATQVPALIEQLPEATQEERAQKIRVRNAWKHSIIFERTDPFLQSFAAALGVSDLDEFFIEAAQE